jgi:hypothetical protein
MERLALIGGPALAAGVVVLLAGLISPVVGMIRLHPYQYVSFNWLAGGVATADKRYMLDYWGLSLKQAAEELRARLAGRGERPPGRRWRVAVCGPHPGVRVALGPDFDVGGDARGADFVLMLGEYYCKPPAAPLLVDIRRAGISFAQAYDTRSRLTGTLP